MGEKESVASEIMFTFFFSSFSPLSIGLLYSQLCCAGKLGQVPLLSDALTNM